MVQAPFWRWVRLLLTLGLWSNSPGILAPGVDGEEHMNTRTHAELAAFIWSICNLLRGPYKRNEYRKVILPLTVLRRFDCVLAGTREEVLAIDAEYAKAPEGLREARLIEAAGRPFYNTSQIDFERLLDDPNQIAPNLSRYIRDFSPNVREVMERFGFEEHIGRMHERNQLYQVVRQAHGRAHGRER